MQLEGDLAVAVEDGTPTFALTVENVSDEPVSCQFNTGCKADFAVKENSSEIWRLTDNRMFTQVISSATFDPGEAATFEATGDELPAGEYTAIGELNATDATCLAKTTFTV